MFEQLGYELAPEGTYAEDKILPYRCYKKNIEIAFYLKEKQFVKTKRVIDCIAIKESELKAIIQQCKELGWLEEEKQETNYENYKDEIIENCSLSLALVDGKPHKCSEVNCCDCGFSTGHGCGEKIKEWLKSPYKKPTYKLSQFEYDLINAFDRCKECCLLNEIECLKKLSEKEYFKGIDPFTKVHDIIDNCEVIK
mgnify:CR=1 FL=1